MSEPPASTATAFEGHTLLLSGPLADVALAVKAALDRGPEATFLVFDDATGHVVDLDLRGSRAEVAGRLSGSAGSLAGSGGTGASAAGPRDEDEAAGRRGPGRPRLGVVAREVTLLPRHWAWLSAQRGGASAALRRLVDEARRRDAPLHARRVAQEAAYRFMTTIGGDLPGYEEALRALFADDRAGMEAQLGAWPQDLGSYAVRLAFGVADGGRAEPLSPGRKAAP